MIFNFNFFTIRIFSFKFSSCFFPYLEERGDNEPDTVLEGEPVFVLFAGRTVSTSVVVSPVVSKWTELAEEYDFKILFCLCQGEKF